MSAGNLLEALTDNLVVCGDVHTRQYSDQSRPLFCGLSFGPEHSGICAVGGSREG